MAVSLSLFGTACRRLRLDDLLFESDRNGRSDAVFAGLFLWIRTVRGFQFRALSMDDGNTWSAPVPDLNFPSPCSPMSLKRDPSTNFLYAVWNGTDRQLYPVLPTTTDRTPLVLMRSRDNGVTWEKNEAVLVEKEPDHGYCYTAMLFHGGTLLLGYCCGRHGNGASQLQDLRIREIDLTELTGSSSSSRPILLSASSRADWRSSRSVSTS